MAEAVGWDDAWGSAASRQSAGGSSQRQPPSALEVEWSQMTGPALRDVAARDGALAIQPVGSLEQHGPHLPVITDTASAYEASVRAARLVAPTTPVAVLPGLWLGMSEHHFPFGGTISIDFQTYYALLRQIARSLKVLGFGRLLIVNGHGGNVHALAIIARELAVELALPIVCATPWYLAEDEMRALFESRFEGRHACEGETSIMLAISPDAVRVDQFEEAMRERPAPVEPRREFVRFYSFAERAPLTGITGDPRLATPEKGELFLDIQARELARGIEDQALWTIPDPVWQPGRGQGVTTGAAC